MSNVFVLDDEKNIRHTLERALNQEGYSITTCGTVREATELIAGTHFDLFLLDIKLPDGDGLAVFRQVKASQPDAPVIIITGAASIKQALEAVRLGAYEILEKPLSLHRTRIAVKNALQLKSLQRAENDFWTAQDFRYRMVGRSKALATVKERIAMVASTQSRVIITGQSGTGKELAAYAIHRASPRCQEPFVRFNVAAVPHELVESELFGHEKGAFTGALSAKTGKFEQAHKGTLFLDEIGDMDLGLQSKILRVLQENEFERLGGNRTMHVDVRVIAATNQDLSQLIKEGKFREDLYYRLNVFPLHIPPLRERLEDISELVEHFTQNLCYENHRVVPRWSQAAVERLHAYSFPGNIRELKNMVERILLEHIQIETIEVGQVEPVLDNTSALRSTNTNLFEKTMTWNEAKHSLEKCYIETQLKKANWNVSATARNLGMEQPNLSKKMKLLGVKRMGRG